MSTSSSARAAVVAPAPTSASASLFDPAFGACEAIYGARCSSGAGAAGTDPSLAAAAASRPPSSGSGPSSSTSFPRPQIQTAETATTITQVATSGHSSPHFRFGCNGGWDSGSEFLVAAWMVESVLLTSCEFKREVSYWRSGPDQHS
jgi:hypothetical protein